MSENKKYYYMKLKENFFTSERMVVLETMPDGILYSNLLLKMYLMSLKHNGVLLMHENLPHTPQTIATFTRHQIGTVERALQIFLKLGFVEDARLSMHDFRVMRGPMMKKLMFDVVVPYDFEISDDVLKKKINSYIKIYDENCYAVINIDRAMVR